LVGIYKGRDYLEDLGVDGKVIKMNVVETRWQVEDWINLA
jgi:hypothetical protein